MSVVTCPASSLSVCRTYGAQTRRSWSRQLWLVRERVQPVARCFTGGTLRVSVFFRTAIHAPGGWALIENLPNVFTGDRITVGLWSTEIPSPEDKALVSLARSSVYRVWRSISPSMRGIKLRLQGMKERLRSAEWRANLKRAVR